MEITELRNLLETLSNEFGPSGRERAVRTMIRERIAGLVDQVEVDALGNLIAFKAGTGPEPRLRVMLAAHSDEVGFMITGIDKSGLLRFHAVGGVEDRIWPAKRVVIGDDRVPGIIGAPVPHLQTPDQANRPLRRDDIPLRRDGIPIVKGPESDDNGRFAWLLDPDGNKVELWQPMVSDEKNKQG
jgi:endoglucanase